MTMDAATFKTIFPEFASAADATIAFWITAAQGLLNEERWSSSLDMGIALFTAHHLVIGSRDAEVATAGGSPGAVPGVVTSKSVDKVSVSYDGSLGTYEGAGFWNQTNYGVRFYQMARLVGAGGIQL